MLRVGTGRRLLVFLILLKLFLELADTITTGLRLIPVLTKDLSNIRLVEVKPAHRPQHADGLQKQTAQDQYGQNALHGSRKFKAIPVARKKYPGI